MKITLVALAGVSLVAAQFDGLPQCAQGCVTKFTSGSNIGGCPQIDAKCICSQQTFLSDIACCLASVCNAADQQAAVDFAIKFCSTQGVQVPTAVSCSTTATSTATGSGTGASTVPAITAGGNSTATTSSAASSSSSTTSASPNAGNAGAVGTAGVFGGLLAALALI
ncbi:hypothetical protein JX265_005479 [Neoarthrinium moseri]|uniref:CFEM domain-containing protein n=1 Tax=Neoarthrinium moseri TaxID=1658444 RepID=A0A9Q0AQJ4_9PEZI|nr:uncharacterized protein JN550_009302 [Neoarthrinium moseri]KAI1845322.1 hypothetical protein JX266_008632 [Neoarthrinium moseri]KAI1863804.1 hypothetical protein JN550_009302 [Neoarthrinium moseri]KAI1872599.1 hypothetical protein JX265_005479 [Neoarthrinium moseri]